MVSGVFLIAGGPNIFANWKINRDASAEELAIYKRLNAGLRYGVLTGIFIASYTVLDGYAVKVMLLSPILVDYLGNFIRLIFLAPVVLRDMPTAREHWHKQWKYAVIVGTISPVSYVLVLYAVQLAPLSHVAPAREVSMLFAALIGGHLLCEGDRWLIFLGATFIATGVIAIVIS